MRKTVGRLAWGLLLGALLLSCGVSVRDLALLQ